MVSNMCAFTNPSHNGDKLRVCPLFKLEEMILKCLFKFCGYDSTFVKTLIVSEDSFFVQKPHSCQRTVVNAVLRSIPKGSITSTYMLRLYCVLCCFFGLSNALPAYGIQQYISGLVIHAFFSLSLRRQYIPS